MPYSRNFFQNETIEFLTTYFNNNKISKIIDVGAGSGKYATLLSGFTMDCIEIFENYIDKFNLKDKYKNVTLGNIVDFDFSEYEFLIFGDVLEHLSINDSINIINKINKNNQKCFIVIPYNSIQNICHNNIYEVHLQSDLTIETMKIRYPSLNLIFGNSEKGCYINF
jgi:hypothetical protein